MFNKKDSFIFRLIDKVSNTFYTNNKDLGEALGVMIRNTEEVEKKLDSLAKELGYEYKSRAVKIELGGGHFEKKEEAVLEWYWDGGDKTIRYLKNQRDSYHAGFEAGEDHAYQELTFAPKKSSKKKLK